jgi:hypothetical protein
MPNTTTAMPSRGHSTAPSFSEDKPRELPYYFRELDRLFKTHNITDSEEKKSQSVRYLSVQTIELWEAIPEFTKPEVPYEDFVKAVLKLYPGSEDDRKWSVSEMDTLIGEQLRVGIADTTQLANYHRNFLVMTLFLLEKGRISHAEQSRAFMRGFHGNLLQQISRRLELKFPDHYPDDPYPLEDILAAAQFVLHGTSPRSSNSSTSTAVTTPTAGIKAEDLTAFLDKFATTLIHALAPQSVAQPSAAVSQQARIAAAVLLCVFCGDPGL